MTVYEALEDAGLTDGGDQLHLLPRPDARTGRRCPGVTRPALRAEALLLLQPVRVGRDRRAARGPEPRRAARSTPTRPRSAAGSSRATASTSSSTTSPTTTSPRTRSGRTRRRRRSRAATRRSAALIEAAGGPDEFLERYAVVVCSDHGQTRVEQAVRARGRRSPRASTRRRRHRVEPGRQVYRLPGCREDARELARRLDGSEAVDVVLFREDGEAVARRDGEELRFALEPTAAWRTSGDLALLDQPDALERAWARARQPERGRRARLGRRRASSSSTSAAAPSSAAAATARSTRATRRCRC